MGLFSGSFLPGHRETMGRVILRGKRAKERMQGTTRRWSFEDTTRRERMDRTEAGGWKRPMATDNPGRVVVEGVAEEKEGMTRRDALKGGGAKPQ